MSLIGYARINKRSKLVCEAIQELYENNALNFSFEISAGVVDVVDGISIVDANEENELTAMAVVSVPAYPESKALELVAEADDMIRFYANASMQISEVDIETVRRRFHELLFQMVGEKTYYLNVLLFCHDCVILYDYQDGNTYKVEYMMDNDDLIIKDFYGVDFVRSEGSEKEMNEEMKVSEVEVMTEEVVAEAEVAVEAVVAEETVVEAEAVVETAEEATEVVAEEVVSETEIAEEIKDDEKEPEKDPDDNDPEDPEDDKDEVAELKKRCAELEEQVKAMNEIKAELDAIKDAQLKAEVDAKKENLRKYAESEGLDAKETVIAEAIENLNYEAIVAEVTANKSKAKEPKKEESYFASYTDIGVTGISYLLKSR